MKHSKRQPVSSFVLRVPKSREKTLLIVNSVSFQTDAIREYWSFCGEIEDLDLMRFPDTGRFKGIAFITYATVRYLKC